jgi:hypothetical protein
VSRSIPPVIVGCRGCLADVGPARLAKLEVAMTDTMLTAIARLMSIPKR